MENSELRETRVGAKWPGPDIYQKSHVDIVRMGDAEHYKERCAETCETAKFGSDHEEEVCHGSVTDLSRNLAAFRGNFMKSKLEVLQAQVMRKPLPLPYGIRSKLVVVGARKADETIFPFLGRVMYHTLQNFRTITRNIEDIEV